MIVININFSDLSCLFRELIKTQLKVIIMEFVFFISMLCICYTIWKHACIDKCTCIMNHWCRQLQHNWRHSSQCKLQTFKPFGLNCSKFNVLFVNYTFWRKLETNFIFILSLYSVDLLLLKFICMLTIKIYKVKKKTNCWQIENDEQRWC